MRSEAIATMMWRSRYSILPTARPWPRVAASPLREANCAASEGDWSMSCLETTPRGAAQLRRCPLLDAEFFAQRRPGLGKGRIIGDDANRVAQVVFGESFGCAQ